MPSAKRTYTQVWNALKPEERREVASDLASVWGAISKWAGPEIAAAINFRSSTVRKADQEHAARLILAAFSKLQPGTQLNLLIYLNIEPRRDLTSSLYDHMGVPHDGVDLAEEVADIALTTEMLKDATTELVKQFPREQVWLCLIALPANWPDSWADAAISAGDAIAPTGFSGISIEPEIADATEFQIDSVDAPSAPIFSTLDRVLIQTVVSTLNQVEGHLEFDHLDDLVQEVVELNDSRAQSHFHRGYVDSLMGRDVSARGPGDNQERRAWYIVGYFMGRLRGDSPSDIVSLASDLKAQDRAALLEPSFGAGAMVAPEIVPHFLRSGALEDAEEWLRMHGLRSGRKLVNAIFIWSDEILLERGDIGGVRRILQALVDAMRLGNPEDSSLQKLIRDVDRRRSIAFRCDGRFAEAQSLVDRLIVSSTQPSELFRLLAQRGLAACGIRWLESFSLPEEKREREAFLKPLVREQETFTRAEQGESASPIALFALALPVVANPVADESLRVEAATRIGFAIDLMSKDASSVWERSGLLGRARAYLALLELRSDEVGVAESGSERLRQILHEGIDVPSDLLLDAVTDAILRDAPGASEAARFALEKLGHRAFPSLDMEHLCRVSSAFRAALISILESAELDLSETERWSAWQALLIGASQASQRDLDLMGRALDALENLAHEHDLAESFLEVLDDQTMWDPTWTRSERDAARYQLLIRIGKSAEARAALTELAHSAVSAGHIDEATEYIEISRELGASEEELAGLRLRLVPLEQPPTIERVPRPSRGGPVSVLFIGGNETQAAYRDYLLNAIRKVYPEAIVDFEFVGWGSNWSRLLAHLDDRIERSDVVVVMKFVRTNLGCSVRKICGKHDRPWVACPGHGRASLERVIIRAIEVVHEQRDGAEGGSPA